MAPRLHDDYGEGLTSASLSALLELGTALGGYRDSLVLVGGWVPFFLIEEYGGEDADFRHVGSIDIDLAVNPATIDDEGYSTLISLVGDRGYSMKLSRDGQPVPSSYVKTMTSPADGGRYEIQVDFLTAATAPFARHRHTRVQSDLRARNTPGCDLAFTHNMRKTLKGILPGGGEAELEMLMLDIPGCLGMKGMALGERYREKDAYDIFSVVSNCHAGPARVAEIVGARPPAGSMKMGLDNIREKFRNIRAEGPSWVAEFMSMDPVEKERIQARAFVSVREFLEALKW